MKRVQSALDLYLKMGDHQIEHYTCFRWTSSDTNVATVDVYGNVTGVSPGTATINLAFTSVSHMEYDSCVCAVMNQDDPSESSFLTCATLKWHDIINLKNKWGE